MIKKQRDYILLITTQIPYKTTSQAILNYEMKE